MARIDEIQVNFNSGELSPNIDARNDFDPYYNGSSILENFGVHPQGWIYRRKGSRFVYEVKNSLKKTRIFRFKYNIDQKLIIEAGEGYFRFFINQAPIIKNSAIYELNNPFVESDLAYLHYIQKDDVIYITHTLKGIYKLIRLANDNWTFAAVNLLYGPFRKENIVSSYNINVSGSGAVGTSHTMTASGFSPFTTNHVGGLWMLRSGTDYGYFKIASYISATQVVVQPQKTLPAAALYNGTNLFTWREGEFSLARGFPKALSFHEQRLVLAGTPSETQKIFFSVTADYENFDIDYNSQTDDDAFDRVIAGNANDSILWLSSDDTLLIGTSEGVWVAKSSTVSSGLKNSDISIKKQSSFGSEWVDPVSVDGSTFYLQRGKQKVRGLNYTSTKGKYAAEDVTIRSDHITGSGLVRFDYQQNPISTIWSLREDGSIATFVYESGQEVSCWSRVKFGDDIVEDIAIIPSDKEYDQIYFVIKRGNKRFIEVIEPSFDYSNLGSFFVDSGLTYDGTRSVPLSIAGTIASSTNSFTSQDVGKQIHNLSGNGRAEIISFIDVNSVNVKIIRDFDSSNLSSWGLAVDEVSGLDHLAGKYVDVFNDGATEPKAKLVDSLGAILLEYHGVIIHAGLKYKSIRQSMPIESKKLMQVMGSSQNKLGRIAEVRARFFNTRGGKVSIGGREQVNQSRNFTDEMNKSVDFVQDAIFNLDGDWEFGTKFTIEQDEPQPMNIKSITFVVSINQI